MTLRYLPQRARYLRMFVLPQFRAAAKPVMPKTNDPATLLMQAKPHGLPTPSEDVLGPPRIAATIFQRHLRLKRPSVRACHLGRSKPDIFNVPGVKRNSIFSYRGDLHQ
jgi:hypothetical protein